MSVWQCSGCAYRCKCEVENSVYCIPKRCIIHELGIPSWKPMEEGKKDVQKEKAE